MIVFTGDGEIAVENLEDDDGELHNLTLESNYLMQDNKMLGTITYGSDVLVFTGHIYYGTEFSQALKDYRYCCVS